MPMGNATPVVEHSWLAAFPPSWSWPRRCRTDGPSPAYVHQPLTPQRSRNRADERTSISRRIQRIQWWMAVEQARAAV